MRTPAKLGLLTSLYLSQGLPYGFFTTALPVVMRKEKISLALIGASAVLAAPWALKFLWAPVVDRFTGSPLGRRRGWIVPLQALTVAMALALAGAQGAFGGSSLVGVMAVGLLVMNALAATQDIATDGLAVDLLTPAERGHGNGVQVAAYRVGMIIGGAVLVWVFDRLGWHATFVAMAAVLAAATLPVLWFRERPLVGATQEGGPVTWTAAVAFLKRKDVLVWLALVAVYKLGDALPGPMAKTMLVDKGYSLSQIGSLFALWGSGAGLLGAMTGGALAKRGRLFALVAGGAVHTLLLAGYAWPAFAATGPGVVATLVVIEHFTGGVATVALFTAMMDVCDPKTGGTDYTVQACAVVLVQLVGSWLSGVSAQAFGYGPHFLLVGAVSALGVVVMAAGFRRHPVWRA